MLYLFCHFKIIEFKIKEEFNSILGLDVNKCYTFHNIFDYLRDYLISAEAKGRAEGEAKGRAEGRTEEKIDIALNLLRQNLSLDLVSSATGLSHDELTELKAKL